MLQTHTHVSLYVVGGYRQVGVGGGVVGVGGGGGGLSPWEPMRTLHYPQVSVSIAH